MHSCTTAAFRVAPDTPQTAVAGKSHQLVLGEQHHLRGLLQDAVSAAAEADADEALHASGAAPAATASSAQPADITDATLQRQKQAAQQRPAAPLVCTKGLLVGMAAAVPDMPYMVLWAPCMQYIGSAGRPMHFSMHFMHFMHYMPVLYAGPRVFGLDAICQILGCTRVFSWEALLQISCNALPEYACP